MKWRLFFAITLLIIGNARGLPAQSGFGTPNTGGVSGAPLRDVAVPLLDLWLRFHEAGLCIGVDSIFVFHAKGLEIWCRVKDERSYQQLSAMVESLHNDYRIDLYTLHSDREKKPYTPEDDDPPPSFWTNAELRQYLRDPGFGRFGGVGDLPANPAEDFRQDPELRRRLKLFCDQVLEWVNKMARLAGDLPPLARAGYGTDLSPGIRTRARAVCLDHAREVEKCAGRLAENLSHALPHGTGNSPGAQPPKEAPLTAASPGEGALLVSRQAQDLSQRILHFIYPQAHTVTLSDLREPSLIDSLKALQQSVSDFESSAKRAR
ncbi:MAG: hypothetical protein ABSH28_14335 [Acidobacteriota bacterium]|jgi:hypothetical protein